MAETSARERARARIVTWEGMLEGDDVLCGGVTMLLYGMLHARSYCYRCRCSDGFGSRWMSRVQYCWVRSRWYRLLSLASP